MTSDLLGLYVLRLKVGYIKKKTGGLRVCCTAQAVRELQNVCKEATCRNGLDVDI